VPAIAPRDESATCGVRRDHWILLRAGHAADQDAIEGPLGGTTATVEQPQRIDVAVARTLVGPREKRPGPLPEHAYLPLYARRTADDQARVRPPGGAAALDLEPRGVEIGRVERRRGQSARVLERHHDIVIGAHAGIVGDGVALEAVRDRDAGGGEHL